MIKEELNTQNKPNSLHESVGFGNLYRKLYSSNVSRDHSSHRLSLKVFLHYIFIILSLVVSVALVFFYAFPAYQEYQLSKTDLEAAQIEYDKTHAQYQYLQDLSNLSEELENSIDLSNESIPLSEDIPQFMNQILRIAEESNVSLEKNDFLGIGVSSSSVPVTESTENESSVPLSSLKQIVFSASVNGNFEQIKKFFELIESSRRLTSIQNISISEATLEDNSNATAEEIIRATSDEKIYSVSFSCLGYFMQEPDLSSLTAADFVQRGDFSSVFERIKQMKYYDLKETSEEIGIETIENFIENDTNAETEETETETGISLD